MNEMTEEQILNEIMPEILGDEIQQEAIEEQPQIQEEIIPVTEEEPQLPTNELVPSKTEELLGQLVQENQVFREELKESMNAKAETPQLESELSEEELALQELAEKLGLTDQLAKVQMLEQKLAEQEQFREQQLQEQQQYSEQQQIHSEAVKVLGDIEKDYGINETVLAQKVDEMIKSGSIPQDRREDPIIWGLVAQNINMTSQPQNTPDAITSTQSAVNTKSASQTRKEGGKVDDMSIVEEILSNYSA